MCQEKKIQLALSRLSELEDLIDRSKRLYAERDLLTMQLREIGFVEAEYEGKLFKLVNNFTDTNVCYRMAFVRQWEVKIKGAK